MSKITSAILAKIAPQTPSALRDRFLPYLNDALPRYGIVTELQVAAFLATAAFESQYFQKTKEGKARASSPIWIKYQSKYWHTNYMGRGIFQTTHERNYRTFGQQMKKKGLVTDSETFVKSPALLEDPRWAVESACEYWETNGLDKYARQGFKGFSALQGRVNKGDANEVAHDYPNRLLVYERARQAIPDGFTLDSAATSIASETPAVSSPVTAIDPEKTDTPNVETSPTVQNAENIINTGTPAAPAVVTQDIELPAPAKEGSTATAVKTSIFGITVPAFILAGLEAIKGLVRDGYVDAKEVASAVIKLIIDNQKYIFMLVGLVIVLLVVKKIVKQVTLWISMLTAAIPSWNTVTIKKDV